MSKHLVKVKDIIDEISMGPFGSDIKVEYFVKSGIPVLNGYNISGVRLKDGFDNFVTEERAATYKKAIAKRGDIVITHRGTLGQIAYIPPDSLFDRYVISQSQFKVRLNADIVNPIYFTYYFHTTEGQKRLLSFKSHVGVPALAQATTNFRLIEFPLIPLEEQNSIASLLELLDNKIELNNRINAELEAMAKSLYDYWFVQFDFPDANGKPYKTSGGKMVYNPTLNREIPEGWSAESLFDAMDVQYGFPFDTSKFVENCSGYPIARIRDVLDNTISCYTTEEVNKKYLLKTNDLLVAMDGNFHINFWSKSGVYLNQRTVRIRDKANSFVSIFQTYFELSPNIKAREKNVSRTTVGHLSDKDLKRLYLLSPNQCESFKPKILFDSMLDKMMLNRQQNEALSSLRDWLLPMLMNGQATVNS